MALQNDPRLFSGGSERIDLRPHVQLYAQLKAREQARDDAFNEYMRNANLKINPAGMRHQDIPAFEDNLKKWQERSIQNRAAIQNPRLDGGKAAMEFQQGYQGMLNRTQFSKTAAEGLKPWLDISSDPKKAKQIKNKDEIMTAIQSQDQPQEVQDANGNWVQNPNFIPFNPSIIRYKADPHDAGKFFKDMSDITPTETVEEEVEYDPVKLQRKIRTTSKFKKDDYERISTRAVGEYGKDEGFTELIDEMYDDKDSKDVLKFNDTYKKIYGKNISSKGELAAAYAIQGKLEESTKEKWEDDKYAQDQALAEKRHRNALALKRTPGAKDEGSEDDSLYLENYWDGVVEKALSNPDNERKGNVLRGGEYQIELDPTISKAFIRQNREPEEMTVRKDGVVTPKYYEYVDDGKGGSKKVLIAELSKPLSRTQALLALGVKATTGKQRYQEGRSAVDNNKGGGYSNITPATHNGKKITMGVKNGKWYNTQTGQEIK